MKRKIQIRRGALADRPTFSSGEFGLDTDTGSEAVYIGTPAGNKLVSNASLRTLGGLTATTDNFIVSVASAWASRTPAQVKNTLAIPQILVGMATSQTFASGSTTYFAPFCPVTGNTGVYRYYFRSAGVLSNLNVWGLGNATISDVTWTVMQGSGSGTSSATTLTKTLDPSGSFQTGADTTHTVSIAADDWIEVRMVVEAAGFAYSTPGWSVEFVKTY